jgi:hypothetical protein
VLSSAYGKCFHDNGDGYENKNNFFTPGKRKSTRDDPTTTMETTMVNQTTTKKPR